MDKVIDRIVEDLFTNGADEKAVRLSLVLEGGSDGGGWGKEAVRSRLRSHMKSTADRITTLEAQLAEVTRERDDYKEQRYESNRDNSQYLDMISELRKRIAELEKECATPILVNMARLAEQLADERAKVESLTSAGNELRKHVGYDAWPNECDLWDALAATEPKE